MCPPGVEGDLRKAQGTVRCRLHDDEVYEMYGIHLAEAEQTLDLVRPSLNDAKLLGIDAGTPVMLFQSLTYDTDGRAIEFNRNYVRGDKCNFNVQFSDKR